MKFRSKRNDVDLVLAEAQRGFDRFDEASAIRFGDSDPVLNDLNARTESFDFFLRIDAHDFVVDPDAQITLLLDEIEKDTRFYFRRHCDPESDEHILAGKFLQNVLGD